MPGPRQTCENSVPSGQQLCQSARPNPRRTNQHPVSPSSLENPGNRRARSGSHPQAFNSTRGTHATLPSLDCRRCRGGIAPVCQARRKTMKILTSHTAVSSDVFENPCRGHSGRLTYPIGRHNRKARQNWTKVYLRLVRCNRYTVKCGHKITLRSHERLALP